MEQHIGLTHLWGHADFLIRGVAIVLFALSIASWTVIVLRAVGASRVRRAAQSAVGGFWEAATLPDALAAIARADTSGAFARVARAACEAADAHGRAAQRGIGAGVSASDFVTRALRSAIGRSQLEMERGLTLLASVGSSSPFIGLLGTVWGIYHALVGLAGAQTVVLDRVAGPVGEALIMTAAGLFVAIPAVLAYNMFVRTNRVALAELDGFARDLHAFLTTGSRPGASAVSTPFGAPVAAAAG